MSAWGHGVSMQRSEPAALCVTAEGLCNVPIRQMCMSQACAHTKFFGPAK